MKLHLGQVVNATNGEFGELGDVVVDPDQGTVTHLVVQPHYRHQQARLVPIALVSELGGELSVALDAAGIRDLQQVAESDFMRAGEPIPIGAGWDIGTMDVIYRPIVEPNFGFAWDDDRVRVEYDRIPAHECEIRRTSAVIDSDGNEAGHVEGFVTQHDHLVAVVVRAGVPGFVHNVLVPFAAVERVRNDAIWLTIDGGAFDALPHTELLGDATEFDDYIASLHGRADSLRAKAAATGRAVVALIDRTLHREPDGG